MSLFYQRAFGSVVLHVVPGTPHCGVDQQQLTLGYKIEIKYSDELATLDHDGFLLDNTAFKGYFTALSTTPVSISCENLAKKIALDLMSMTSGRNVEYIEVSLSPFSGIEVEYKLTGGVA